MKTKTSLQPRRFGIELEISRRLVCASYSERTKNANWGKIGKLISRKVNDGEISHGWRLKTDTSCGGELVSPPIMAPQGLTEIATVCSAIKDFADKVGKPLIDGECGIHIHLDAHMIKPRHLSNLFIILHMAEPIIFAMYPNRNFEYCAPISLNMNLASRFRDWTDVRDAWYRGQNNVKIPNKVYSDNFINSTKTGDYYDGTRYHGLNIHCFWRQGTVEFRYGSGTFDINHIKAYYEMCLAMMNTAVNSKSIKIDDSIKKLKYRNICNFYNSNYRFRKYFRRLCNMCGFSRDTIKLMLELIKKNNPDMLRKDPNLVPTYITKSNKTRFLFKERTTGIIYNADGSRATRNTRNKRIIDCKLVNKLKEDSTAYRHLLVPIHKMVYIDFELELPKPTRRVSTDTGYWTTNTSATTSSNSITEIEY